MEKETKIIAVFINGQEKQIEKGELSYQEIVELAFGEFINNPNTTYTVLYFKGNDAKPKGELVKGEFLKVRHGIIINVTRTDKS